MDPAIYISLGTAVVVIAHIIRATWNARGLVSEMREHIDAQLDNLQRDVTKLEKTGMERAETLRHEFGETGQALRTKIHEMETWNRDNFVRTDVFDSVVNRIEKSMEKGFDKIDKHIENAFQRFQKNG
jgi:hypothetical protein